jgi:hypothetical protein
VTSAHLRLIGAIEDVVGCNTAGRRALSLFPPTGIVDEWFSTGGIGRVDEDSYFYLVVREYIWPSNKPSPRPQILAGDCYPSHRTRFDFVTAYIDRRR